MISFPTDPGWNDIKKHVNMRDPYIRRLVLTAEKQHMQIIHDVLAKSYLIKLDKHSIVACQTVGAVLRVLEAWFKDKGTLPYLEED